MKQLSKSYMLRTGQMRLPVRVIKPLIQELPALIQELPDFPIIGEYYMCNGKKVKCIESETCSVCVNVERSSCDSFGKKCRSDMRRDGKSVIFIKAD